MNKNTICRALCKGDVKLLSKLQEGDYVAWVKGLWKEITKNDRAYISIYDKIEDIDSFFESSFCDYNSLNDYLSQTNLELSPNIRCVYNISDTIINTIKDKLKDRAKVKIIDKPEDNITLIYLDYCLFVLMKTSFEVNPKNITQLILWQLDSWTSSRRKDFKEFRKILEQNLAKNEFNITAFEDVLDILYAVDYSSFVDGLENNLLAASNRVYLETLSYYNNYKCILAELMSTISVVKDKVNECKNTLMSSEEVKDINIRDEFIKAIESFPNVSVLSASANTLRINVDTYLKTWSKADLKLLLKNSRSFLRTIASDTRDNEAKFLQLILDVFYNKKYKIKISQDLVLEGMDCRNGFSPDDQRLLGNRMFNPHITWYNCFGQAQLEYQKAFSKHDFVTGIAQLVAAVQSITVTDSTVFSRFLREQLFNNSVTYKILEDKDGKEYSVEDLLNTEYKNITKIPNFDKLDETDVAKETL